jgi:hypothetical protein
MKEIRSYIEDKFDEETEDLYIINLFNINNGINNKSSYEYLSYEKYNGYVIIFGKSNSKIQEEENFIKRKLSDEMYNKKLANYEMIKNTILEFFTYFNKEYKKKNKKVEKICDLDVNYEEQIFPGKKLFICWSRYGKNIDVFYYSKKHDHSICIDCGKYTNYMNLTMDISQSPLAWNDDSKLITIDDKTMDILENFVDFIEGSNLKTSLIRYK